MPVTQERAAGAIAKTCASLRRRKAVEEGAHASIIAILTQGLSSKGLELHAKVESLQQELSQEYKSKAQFSEQLVHEMQTTRALRSELAEKHELLSQAQAELESTRVRLQELEAQLKDREAASGLLRTEVDNLKARVKELETSVEAVEAENKDLIERWMTQKLLDAENINEANAMYQDLVERHRATSLAELAKQQVDGIVRHAEAGAENYLRKTTPSAVKHTMRAHGRDCSSLAFEHHSDALFSAGHDNLVKLWETSKCTTTTTLTGSLGAIMDLAISGDNNQVLAAASDEKLYLWDVHSARIKHILTGHLEKVTSVDWSPTNSKRAVSSSCDRTLKIWDIHTGYSLQSILCFSICHSLCVTSDVICSGHADGTLRFWDMRTGKQVNEIMAHEPHGITSVTLSKSGNTVLSNGRDNLLRMFDVRTLESNATFGAAGYSVATSWSRACMSSDESYVASGSSDGSVFIWSRAKRSVEKVLKGHSSPVVACAWSDLSSCLATADKSGSVCIWE